MGDQSRVGAAETGNPAASGGRVILAACDGACSGNPGPGGWGALLRFEDGSVLEMGGHAPATTNNRMELTGALEVLKALRLLPRHPKLELLTDSRYLVDGLQTWLPGWKRKGWRTAGGGPVLNRDLWEQLDSARLEGVALRHVRGHSGHPENDRCDAIAVAYSRGSVPRLAGASPSSVQGVGASASRSPRPKGEASSATSASVSAAGAPTGSGARADSARVDPARAVGARVNAASASAASASASAASASLSAASASAPSASSSGDATSADGIRAKELRTKDHKAEGHKAADFTAADLKAEDQKAEDQRVQEQKAQADPAPAALRRLLSRLELADRLAAGGHGLTAVELAQLVEQPLAQLERRQGAWRWRDWMVEPNGQGRWRLRRADGGWSDAE